MSRCTISGNVGQDAELAYTPDGKPYLKFSVATQAGKDKEGQYQTTWVRVTVWGPKSEALNLMIRKGMHVICHGYLKQPEVYESAKYKDQRANIEFTAFEVKEAEYVERDLLEASV